MKWTSSILKTFALQNLLLEDWKEEPSAGGKYLQITYLRKDLYPEYVKNSQNSKIRKGLSWCPVVRTLYFQCRGVWVQSLVRELRSLMPQSVAKKIKRNKLWIHTTASMNLKCLLLSKRRVSGISLVVQWMGIHLSMQGTQVWYLVQEDSACRGATKPVHHNDWTCVLEPESGNYWALVP